MKIIYSLTASAALGMLSSIHGWSTKELISYVLISCVAIFILSEDKK